MPVDLEVAHAIAQQVENSRLELKKEIDGLNDTIAFITEAFKRSRQDHWNHTLQNRRRIKDLESKHQKLKEEVEGLDRRLDKLERFQSDLKRRIRTY